MPRYFIDTDNGDQIVRDTQGFETADFETARRLADDVLPNMARDELPNGPERTFRAVIRDEAGAEVYAAELRFKGMRLT